MNRQKLDLDGEWQFFPDPKQTLSPENLPDDESRPIRVPGPWQAQFDDLRDYSGVAWYRRSLVLRDGRASAGPPDSPPIYILHFGAVDYFTTVWLNGKPVGEHEGGYLPFELDVTQHLRWDVPNDLVVRVIDPGNDADFLPEFPFAEIPHGKQSWYGPIGGIWQSVYLERRPATHINRLRVTPDVPGEQARVLTVLNRATERPRGLWLNVTDPKGQIRRHRFVFPAGTDQLELTIPVSEPMLWDTTDPNLYQIQATLLDGSDDRANPLDQFSAVFGMRTIGTSPSGHLLLNGRVLYVRGALDQDYYPDLVYTPFSDAELDEQFARAKHMGLNLLRTHIKVTDPRYYDAADRAGLLIWTELPNWQELTESAKRRAKETMVGMVERDWNHPSIVIWTIVNENWGVDLAVNAGHRAWLADMYTQLKELDPHRLVVGNSPCFTNFHVVTDIEDFHNYYAMPDHYRKWKDWVQTFASRPPWTFAHVYESIESWRQYINDPWNPLPRQQAPEVRRRGSEPMVVSEFGNWGLPDITKLKECYGGEPWWFETGIEWGDGVVYPHGLEQRFKAFHLDKVFPTLADLSAASQRMQFTALKYQIEQMRRHPSIVGYVITEFTDVHWESNGLLDMCRNPKTYYDVIGQVNCPDAIVPTDWERIAFWEGERCEVKLALSHFSSSDLRGSRLEWQLDLWPEIHGVFENVAAERAQLTSLGTVVFDVPRVEQAVRTRLELRLLNAAGELVTRNHHELYFFPRLETAGRPLRLAAPGLPRLAARLTAMGYELTGDLAAADLVVVETMTDDLRWYAQNGGKVLWLAESPESQQAHLGPISIAQRQGRSWQGDWASSMSWIRQDKIFGGIPSGGTVDFAFADLTPETVIVGLSPRDFAANVHSGLFVGWAHHIVALVAERPIDRGRLMICTYRLRDHLGTHPVATIMMHDMLARLAGSTISAPAHWTPPSTPATETVRGKR
ncbi:MAG TPA: glycoside hydrolase family 2 TIM barrel-domain containing protein [Gemmatimonadales bacterium]|nr:glycoside hydrolase family 2 TIM barrel-domain containing protein [Gemmatimonadales bacterium]